MVANAGLVSESEGVEPHRHVVVLPVDDAEDEVDEAEEGAEVAADEVDVAAEAGAAEVGAVETKAAEAKAGETTETVDSPADAVEEA